MLYTPLYYTIYCAVYKKRVCETLYHFWLYAGSVRNLMQPFVSIWVEFDDGINSVCSEREWTLNIKCFVWNSCPVSCHFKSLKKRTKGIVNGSPQCLLISSYSIFKQFRFNVWWVKVKAGYMNGWASQTGRFKSDLQVSMKKLSNREILYRLPCRGVIMIIYCI